MRRIKQAKPSAALIVAVVALVAALGGGAVAGVAVTSLSKKDKKQVTKIAKKQAKKQSSKAVAGIPAGPEGPAGPTGDQGPEGAMGDPGATDVVARNAEASVPAGDTATVVASCLAGEVATGGGVGFNNPNQSYEISLSEPVEADGSLPEEGDVPTGWGGKAKNQGASASDMVTFVICASP